MKICEQKINQKQHGFLPAKSCTTQMIPFYDNIALTINDLSSTDIIYFDFAKAFDSVNHDIILHKLKYQFHIDGLLVKFIVNYLQERIVSCNRGQQVQYPPCQIRCPSRVYFGSITICTFY